MPRHSDLIGTDAIHQASYVQDSDPGAVGAGKLWIDTSGGVPYQLMVRDDTDTGWDEVGIIAGGGGGGGAPDDATYLVASANGSLSAEVVVGTTPGGELGGTWASPTVDTVHSGSAHHSQSHDHSAAGDGTALNPVTLVVPVSANPSPTADGDLKYDSTSDALRVGTGSGYKAIAQISTGNPTTQAFGDTPTPGTGVIASLIGHKHGMPATVAPTLLDFSTSPRFAGRVAGGAGAGAELTISDLNTQLAPTMKLGYFYVPASALLPTITNGATGPTQVELPTTGMNLSVMDFVDSATKYAHFDFAWPPDYDGQVIKFAFDWYRVSPTVTGDVKWQVEWFGFADGDTLDAGTWVGQTIVDTESSTGSAALYRRTARTAGSSTSTGAGGLHMRVRVSRLGSDAADTLTSTVSLMGVVIRYSRDSTVGNSF